MDSFATLQQRIESEKILTWEEAYGTVKSEFAVVEGQQIRHMLKSSERYCQGNSLGDRCAVRILEDYTGSCCLAGLWMYFKEKMDNM